MRDRVAGQRGWGFNCDYCDLYKIQNSLCAKNHRSIRHFVQNSRYSLTALSSNTETKGEKKKKKSPSLLGASPTPAGNQSVRCDGPRGFVRDKFRVEGTKGTLLPQRCHAAYFKST